MFLPARMALMGVLQRLETMYEGGFFWGLPVADFQWALLWQASYPYPRKRREGFPTWSWAGWEEGIRPSYPFNVVKPHEFTVHLQIWKLSKERLMEVFRTPQPAVEGSSDVRSPFHRDPISIAETCELRSPKFDVSQYPGAEGNGYLFVEAIVLHSIPALGHPQYNIRKQGDLEPFIFPIGDMRCYINIISTYPEMIGSVKRTEQQFLLLARDRTPGLVYHHLLLVHPRGDVVERGTVIELMVPEDHLEVLDHLKPQKQRIALS